MNIFVQFSDSSETTVVSVFGSAQDPTAWPNQGVIPSSDARYTAYYNGLPPQFRTGLPVPG